MTSTSEQPFDSCQLSVFGCCPDGYTAATGVNLEGCIGVDFDNCTLNGAENNTSKLFLYLFFYLSIVTGYIVNHNKVNNRIQ